MEELEEAMAMNYVRFKSVLSNMTAAAQKTYAAIPAHSAWTHDEINIELKRLGSHMEYRTMQGCINSLIGAGLVREVAGGGKGPHFLRAEVRGKPTKPLKAQEEEAIEQPTEDEVTTMANLHRPTQAQAQAQAPAQVAPAVKNPVDMLGELAAKTRALSAQLNSLAMEIDSAALAAQDYVEHSDKDTDKLRQLQALLKGLV